MSLSSPSARKWAFGGLIAGSTLLLSLLALHPAFLSDATGRPVTFVPNFAHVPNTGFTSSRAARLTSYLAGLEDVVKELPNTTTAEQPVSTDWSGSIANRTLGVSEIHSAGKNEMLITCWEQFEKIFVISLPSRSDKRESISVQASLTDFDVNFVAGVKDADIDGQTMQGEANVLGCWRAHMNVLQMIVNQNIATALILEDDADWDVGLRAQLVQYARGARYLQGVAETTVTRSAYGEDWDMLWLGHCAALTNHTDKRRFTIANDPTVEPVDHRQYWECGSIAMRSRWGGCHKIQSKGYRLVSKYGRNDDLERLQLERTMQTTAPQS
ncbi:hypothetical protein LTR10_014323 [Elasticomyces elasticus]|uniref:Glycosyl transferase family 25 domain-containing protein n=1 Tax=Exophiala sideris TaxID=1016849 RepID=A0ABR0JJY6_9EURO|nr:hypothetical protein LTR10_014323 [Elasticomyces elasticus]KAK5034365.1 hypothetical protein LTS07_003286 [Exophiala sideris]KAK5042662.1 hypothetical protein LTR13_001510 [Exophiala sideris]KAK5065744.1 hypothetical protein LTR69_003294 [Exophiala sideris]KAK5185795.1 hypothetical protein LTR44_001844 [Eurotiomycetes sp. CCFEE 6388]